jgi:hypothetical protein
MMKQTLALLVLGVISTGLFSCSHSRHLGRANFPVADSTKHTADSSGNDTAAAASKAYNAEMVSKIRGNNIAFNTFSAHLKADYESENKKPPTISVVIRMKRDSIIWISANVPIIGEVARAVITPDSVKAINKIDKKVILRDFNQAKDVLKIPFDFKTLQDLLVGNPVFLTDSVFQVVKTPSVISFNCDSTDFTSVFNVFADDFTLQQSKMSDKDPASGRSCELTYGEYKMMGGHKFATLRRVFVEEKHITKINMDFSKVEFDVPLTYPLSIPSSYSKE